MRDPTSRSPRLLLFGEVVVRRLFFPKDFLRESSVELCGYATIAYFLNHPPKAFQPSRVHSVTLLEPASKVIV